MALAVLYKYMIYKYIVDKLLALTLVTDSITKSSIIIRIFGYSLLVSIANL